MYQQHIIRKSLNKKYENTLKLLNDKPKEVIIENLLDVFVNGIELYKKNKELANDM